MEKETILKLWNNGLSRMNVAKEYMKIHNKKRKQDKEIEKIDIIKSLQIVEPILFEYETERMKG